MNSYTFNACFNVRVYLQKYLFHFPFQYQLFPVLLRLETLDFAFLCVLLFLQLSNRLAVLLFRLTRLLCLLL